MFSLKILEGDKDPLHDPYSIVLTMKLPKYFSEMKTRAVK
jgi:hypothetical protein